MIEQARAGGIECIQNGTTNGLRADITEKRTALHLLAKCPIAVCSLGHASLYLKHNARYFDPDCDC